jgi:hypothetical protein
MAAYDIISESLATVFDKSIVGTAQPVSAITVTQLAAGSQVFVRIGSARQPIRLTPGDSWCIDPPERNGINLVNPAIQVGTVELVIGFAETPGGSVRTL